MTEVRARRNRALSPATFTTVVIGGLVLAAVAAWGSLLLVVQGRVIPGWGVSAALLVAVLVFRWAFTRRRRRDGTSPLGLPRKQAEWARRTSALLIVTAVLGTVLEATADLLVSAEYHVLHPEGPEGCTAVVRETSFLVIGDGEVFAVGRTGLAFGTAGSWTVDDGYRPVEEGAYELDWGEETGALRIIGTITDPVVRSDMDGIDCWW
ncbi:hypothetical protein [Streptomyces chilikensis]|uniref:hypothetical protein n=1 Tax=Streptomyces chilikensis TaxID=1194079 RepID=UPI000AFAEFEE|nr:hypothetical protein [Streptomyces chilikensis]